MKGRKKERKNNTGKIAVLKIIPKNLRQKNERLTKFHLKNSNNDNKIKLQSEKTKFIK